MKISSFKFNPNNPRNITDEKLEKLKNSISSFEKMMELRPIIIDEDNVVLGGNMRLRALEELGYQDIPKSWYKKAKDLTEEEKKEFIIKDNVGFGEWDFDILLSQWEEQDLSDWALDVNFDDNNDPFLDNPNGKPEKKHWTPDCLFESNNQYDIPTLIVQETARLNLPFVAYGSEKRKGNTGIGTYHFYVDDYRFQKIWDEPETLIQSGCQSVAEPNISLFDTTPIAYGLHLIYKKRWLARYMQTFNIKVFVDLFVSEKFYPYALIGVPEGYGQYITRGQSDSIKNIELEYKMAKEHHGGNKDSEFVFVVYGGGAEAKNICADLNVIFVDQFMKKRQNKIN